MTSSLVEAKLRDVPTSYTYKLETVTQEDHPRRSVSFLLSDDPRVRAKTAFDRLKEKHKNHFRTRFRAWIQGDHNDDWFHGWKKSAFDGQYTHCFVFKYLHLYYRIYGFIHHPKSNRRYEACVLVCNDIKTTYKTEERNLRICEELRCTMAVINAIDSHFK